MEKEGKKTKSALTRVEILKSCAGVYKLSCSPGDKIRIESKQASEMIAEGYAKKIK